MHDFFSVVDLLFIFAVAGKVVKESLHCIYLLRENGVLRIRFGEKLHDDVKCRYNMTLLDPVLVQ